MFVTAFYDAVRKIGTGTRYPVPVTRYGISVKFLAPVYTDETAYCTGIGCLAISITEYLALYSSLFISGFRSDIDDNSRLMYYEEQNVIL